jgi:hypothetical protein
VLGLSGQPKIPETRIFSGLFFKARIESTISETLRSAPSLLGSQLASGAEKFPLGVGCPLQTAYSRLHAARKLVEAGIAEARRSDA